MKTFDIDFEKYRPGLNQDLLKKRYYQGGESSWEDVCRRVARHAAPDDEQLYNDLFGVIYERKFLPSRMTYMGTDFPFASSCFVFPIEDSLSGIMQTLSEVCQVQKYGGGSGINFSNLRPKGDLISTSGGEASGPVSFMSLFHNAMEVVHRAGKKHAAQMGVLNCDHPDIFEFIHCKDTEGALWTFNISVAVTDAFIEAINIDDDWTLTFKGKSYKTVKARQLWNEIVEHAWHNGDPGVIFIDTVNKNNRYPEMIEASNPCFAPGTLIQTKQGHFPIESLVGKVVDVWDGSQWVEINNFRVTGRYQPTLKINLQGGDHIIVTPAHKMILDDGQSIEAKDIKPGNKLAMSSSPLTHGAIAVEGAYLKGFLLGDGTHTQGGRPILWVYQPKKVCSARLLTSLGEMKHKAHNTSVIVDGVFRDEASLGDRNAVALMGMTPCKDDLIEWSTAYKLGLPDEVFAWDLQSKTNLIAGIFDADGTVTDSVSNGFSYQLSSIHKTFLLSVKCLLATMGVNSTIGIMKKAGFCDFNDGYGEYESKDCFRLSVPQNYSVALASQVKFERLPDFSNRLLKYNVKPKHNVVVSIDDDGVEEVVYCCTVPTTHMISLSNGIITGQCGEQMLPPHVSCNLGSIDLSKFVKDGDVDLAALNETVRLAILFLDGSVQNSFIPVKKIQDKTRQYRNIGLGVMGWADMLILLGIPFDSESAVTLGEFIMRNIDQTAHSQSIRIGRGTRVNTTVTSIAPTGSISMLAGCSSGIEPIFGITTMKNTYVGSYYNTHWIFEAIAKERGFYSEALLAEIAHTGSVQHCKEVPDDIKKLFKTTLELDWVWHVSHQAAFQKYVDNAVSKTINLPNTATVDDVSQAYMLAYSLGCKSITVYRDGSRQVQVLENTDKKRETCPKCKAILFMDDGIKKCVSCGYVPVKEEVVQIVPSKAVRPAKLTGVTYKKETPIGKAYITVNDVNNEPVEVFINVGKAGSEVAAVSEAMGRLISLVLRLPADSTSKHRLLQVIDNLVGIGGGRHIGFGPKRVKSLPDGIAQVLSEHLNGRGESVEERTPSSSFITGEICPDCGEATLLYLEGCNKCSSCGYSEC